jgi:sulfate-transporting ATPase
VKLYAFAVSAGLAAVAGVLVGFKGQVIKYDDFNVFASINSVGLAVIGGLGYVLGAAFGALNAVGGIGTKVIVDWIDLKDQWDLIIGSLLVFVILIVHQNGIADVVAHSRQMWEKVRLAPRPRERAPLPPAAVEPVAGATLSIVDLTVRFGSVMAVNDVSLEVRPGEVVGLIGPNGAGKTTLIDAVTGFVGATRGAISLDGRRIDQMNATGRARLGVRRSFQSLELFEDISVEENIRAGSDQGASRVSWVTDLFWPGRHDLPSTAVAAVHEFDLERHLDQTPEELPYGRRRLVGIARTVASGPSIVLLDEPAAGLDENESAELARLIRRLADERNMGVLLVEHDVNLVMSTCDQVVVIDFGAVIARGTPAQVRGDQAVRDAYLGQAEPVQPVESAEPAEPVTQ